MKKIISLVMCAVMLLCCGCFAGCGNSGAPNNEDIKNALINAGFSDAYIDGKYVSLSKDKSGFVSLNDDGVFDLINFDEDDVSKALSAVMPLFCNSNEGDFVYDSVKRNRTITSEGKIDGGLYSTTNYEYREIYYNSDSDSVESKIDIFIEPVK